MSVAKSMWDLAHPWWEFVLRGAIIYVVLRDQKLSMGELQSALRQHGCETPEEVHCARFLPA
jgi:uncharacterized membrane protein YcaP (DUF421 family)